MQVLQRRRILSHTWKLYWITKNAEKGNIKITQHGCFYNSSGYNNFIDLNYYNDQICVDFINDNVDINNKSIKTKPFKGMQYLRKVESSCEWFGSVSTYLSQ